MNSWHNLTSIDRVHSWNTNLAMFSAFMGYFNPRPVGWRPRPSCTIAHLHRSNLDNYRRVQEKYNSWRFWCKLLTIVLSPGLAPPYLES